ncbi:hypothetical protein [Micromonospora echinofusca]|uniref:Nitrate and nitrite sensing n=1 Tax=Micromonospora echinofusca TaxID=47858 RepID=A0ABS3VR59_MICEH|nr:hypothetical protein [Micromonospora echinofusca]MBO4207025.1 hypothetical protein [Micromonospora echinofusca]
MSPVGSSQGRRRETLRRVTLASLAIALLIPGWFLFTQTSTATKDAVSLRERQQQGVEYLGSLGQLLNALTENQAGVVVGRPVGQEGLDLAVVNVTKTDQRLGAALGTRQRWQDLSAKIDEVRRTDGNPQTAYLAYTEATDLLLALYRTVRDNSGLSTDRERDIYQLQQAVGYHLPVVVVHAARLLDLATLAARRQPPGGSGGRDPRRQPAATPAQVQAALVQAAAAPVAAAQMVDSTVDEMTDALKEAVDATSSRTLSGNLLSLLDRVRRAADTIVLTAANPGAADPTQLPTVRTELQNAAGDLSAAALREIDGVVDQRLDDLRGRSYLSLGALVTAVTLTLALALLSMRGGSSEGRGGAAGVVPDAGRSDGTLPGPNAPAAGRADELPGGRVATGGPDRRSLDLPWREGSHAVR